MGRRSTVNKILLLGIAIAGSHLAQAQAPKRRIAIYDFDYSSVKAAVVQNLGADSNIGHNVAEMLLSPLTESGAYEVIDRARIEMLLKEQNLKFSSRFDASQAISYGKILQVDAIITGTVNDVTVEEEEKTKGLLGVGRKSMVIKATVELTAQMISTETGQIYLAPTGTGIASDDIGSSNSGIINFKGSNKSNQSSTGDMSNVKHSTNYAAPVVRKAIHEALSQISKDMIAKADGLPRRLPGTRVARGGAGIAAADNGGSGSAGAAAADSSHKSISALIMDISGDTVFIDKGGKAGVQTGDNFEVRRYLKTVKAASGKMIRLDHKIGTLQITEVNDDWASGKFTGDTPAQKDDSVRLH